MDSNSQKKPGYTIAPNNELRIRYVSHETYKKLYNVAYHQGVTLTTLVKMHLKDILALYPPEFQNDSKKD